MRNKCVMFTQIVGDHANEIALNVDIDVDGSRPTGGRLEVKTRCYLDGEYIDGIHYVGDKLSFDGMLSFAIYCGGSVGFVSDIERVVKECWRECGRSC